MHTCWTDLSRRQHCKTSEVQADWYAWGTQTLIPDDWQPYINMELARKLARKRKAEKEVG